MFCRVCHYDLRGLDTPRCPECGRSFVPDDQTSFLTELPNTRSRMRAIRDRCASRRIAILSCAAGLWAASIVLLLPGCPVYHGVLRYHLNLNLIMTEWMIQQNDRSPGSSFDKVAAREDMQPSISPWTERWLTERRFSCRYLLSVLPLVSIPAACCAGLVWALWRGRTRRFAAFLFVLFILTLIPWRFADWANDLLFPCTYNFLDDYVFLDQIDFRSTADQRGQNVAAYDWRTFQNEGKKHVAFADGHIDWLEDDRARSLFAAQGIPYPEPKNPDD